MSNFMKSISKKESRVYENPLDYPRFIMNEILSKWKSYQVLKPHDKRVKTLVRYLACFDLLEDIDNRVHCFGNMDDIQIKETKFMNYTMYLVSGIDLPDTVRKEKINRSVKPIIYKYLEDGTRYNIILFVDPIRDFYLNPRTIISRNLKEYDKEWLESQEDKNLYNWFYKVYHDLCELITDLYTEYPEYRIGTKEDKYLINLSNLLVESVFTWYYYNDETETNHSNIIRKDYTPFDSKNILLMIFKSLHIYPHTKLDNISTSDGFNKSIENTLEFTKIFITEEFKDADILTRSMMIKEKELELNHD